MLFLYLQGFQCDGGVHPSLNEPYHSLRNCGLLGRDTEAHELFEQTQERRHISVWGMPGVGKSVIIGAIYYKPRTSDNFKKHAWVNVCHCSIQQTFLVAYFWICIPNQLLWRKYIQKHLKPMITSKSVSSYYMNINASS